MNKHDDNYLDACARRLDASLWPILDRFCAANNLTRADLLATPDTANNAGPDAKPNAEPVEVAS